VTETSTPDPQLSVLQRLEDYFDAVPRGSCDVEDIGGFTLFVARSGWPYYARPRLGASGETSSDDVRRVLERQQELGVPRKFEWVDEVSPQATRAIAEAGLEVERMPLLTLAGEPVGADSAARMLTPDETETITLARAAVSLGFRHEGTASGPAGTAERDREAADPTETGLTTLLERMAAGRIWMGAVWAPGEEQVGPVGGGSYAPVGRVAEIAGVAVLPAFRRRGLAAQLTCALARHALSNGITTVFCSAQSAAVARVYEGVGFRRVGTACAAEAG
jgi:ribosomal protein S18 acetylase RimI-like enzyme